MRNMLIAACLALAAVVALSSLAGAAPLLAIQNPPVTPNPSWTGPSGDPHATGGQWFRNVYTGMEENRTYEFYDNTSTTGGGGQGTNAIKGVVTNIGYSGANIASFSVSATIYGRSMLIASTTRRSEGPLIRGSWRQGPEQSRCPSPAATQWSCPCR